MDDKSAQNVGEPADIPWLLDNANQALEQHEGADALQRARSLSARFGPRRGRLLCELAALRSRARTKFSRADEMFFTRRSLQQASDERIAGYKATRYHDTESLIDLCAGIGGDAIAFGLLQPCPSLTLVEQAAELCAYAEVNLKVYGVPQERLEIRCEDIRHTPWDHTTAWHIDPDRRINDRRRTSPDAYEPPLAELLERVPPGSSGSIKLAPAADAQQLLDQGAELEWMGHRRECQQLVAWFGALARYPGQRVASVLGDQEENDIVTCCDEPAAFAEISDHVLRYVYEPAPPVLAGGLEQTVACGHGWQQLAAGVVYFTSDTPCQGALFSRFEVIASLPFRKQAIKKLLKKANLKVTEVKKRSVDIDPAVVLRQLRGTGEEPVSLLLYPRQRSLRAILGRRA